MHSNSLILNCICINNIIITSTIICHIIVPCNDKDVRIGGGDGLTYGRFEVCISGVWGTICSDTFWDNTDAGVACKELGFSQYGML